MFNSLFQCKLQAAVLKYRNDEIGAFYLSAALDEGDINARIGGLQTGIAG